MNNQHKSNIKLLEQHPLAISPRAKARSATMAKAQKAPYLHRHEFRTVMQIKNLLADGESTEARRVFDELIDTRYDHRVEPVMAAIEFYTPLYFTEGGQVKISKVKLAEAVKERKEFLENGKNYERKVKRTHSEHKYYRTGRGSSRKPKVDPRVAKEPTGNPVREYNLPSDAQVALESIETLQAEIKELKKERTQLRRKVTMLEKKLGK